VLWTIVACLLVIWLFLVVAVPSVSGLVHILLILAALVVIIQLLSARRFTL